jgi:hypothetical protein
MDPKSDRVKPEVGPCQTRNRTVSNPEPDRVKPGTGPYQTRNRTVSKDGRGRLPAVRVRAAVGHFPLAAGEPREFVIGVETREDGVVE